MYCERQIRSLHLIPPHHRICQTDATGGLVHIPQRVRKFNQILNYFIIVKNLANIKAPALPVAEKVSSSHNTNAIEELFNKFIFDYKSVYPNEKLILSYFNRILAGQSCMRHCGHLTVRQCKHIPYAFSSSLTKKRQLIIQLNSGFQVVPVTQWVDLHDR